MLLSNKITIDTCNNMDGSHNNYTDARYKGTPCSSWWALDFFLRTCFILVNTSAPHTLYNTQSDFLKCVSDHITPLQRLPTEHKVNAQVLTVAPRVLNHMVWSCFSTCHLPIFPNRPALSGSFLSQCLHIYLPLLAWAVCSSLQKAWS